MYSKKSLGQSHSFLRLCGSLPLALLFGVLLPAGACGYRLAGRAGPGPASSLHTLAIPAFENQTFQFKIEQRLTEAVIHEFLTRTSYRVQSGGEGSDATLLGVITGVYSGPIVFDPNSGRTTEVLITVNLRVSLVDSHTGETLYQANDLIFRESYEVSTDPNVYFGENQPALDRLSRQVAASLVSTILASLP